MLNIQLYPITREASKWRDLDVKMKRAELGTRVALAAGLVIVLTAMALGSYFCVTTTHTYIAWNGVTVTQSNALWTVFPVVFGTMTLVGLIIGCVFSNFERHINRRAEDLSTETAQLAVVQLLTQGELPALYAKYYKRNGGLSPLVHKRFLTPSLGERLRVILKEYNEKQQLIFGYEAQTFTSKAINANRYPESYCRAKKCIHGLTKAWYELREEIGAHYHTREIQKVKPLAPPQFKEVISTPLIMTPVNGAKKWRDLDRAEINHETALKTFFVALAVVLTVGAIVGIYFCCTTQSWFGGQVHENGMIDLLTHMSNDIFGLFPGMIGFGGAIGAIVGACMSNYECINNGWREKLEKAHARDDRVLMLTEGTLDEVYTHYYKKRGGLGSLLGNGFLTTTQGDALRTLFKEHAKTKKALAVYLMKNIDHSALTERQQKLEACWLQLQVKIKENFHRDYLSALPKDVAQYIFSYLPSSDLQNIPTNKSLKRQVDLAYTRRAKEYGGETEEGKRYLDTLYAQIVTLAKKGYIPQEHIVYRRAKFVRTIDAEATLRKMRYLSSEQREVLKRELGRGLLAYVAKGDEAMMKSLLTLGADTEVRDEDGFTPLIIAVRNGQQEHVRLLVQKGADANVVEYRGRTPLIHAILYYIDGSARCFEARFNIVQLLLENGGDKLINYQGGTSQNTPLHHAAGHAHFHYYSDARKVARIKLLNLLLQYGADKTVQNASHQTPDLGRFGL